LSWYRFGSRRSQGLFTVLLRSDETILKCDNRKDRVKSAASQSTILHRQFRALSSVVKLRLNAVRAHAKRHANNKTSVFSPADTLIDDGNANAFVANRQSPPAGSGLDPASNANRRNSVHQHFA